MIPRHVEERLLWSAATDDDKNHVQICAKNHRTVTVVTDSGAWVHRQRVGHWILSTYM